MALLPQARLLVPGGPGRLTVDTVCNAFRPRCSFLAAASASSLIAVRDPQMKGDARLDAARGASDHEGRTWEVAGVGMRILAMRAEPSVA